MEWLAIFGFACVDCHGREGDLDIVIGRKIKLEADHENPAMKETRRPHLAEREYNQRAGRQESSADIFSRSKVFRERELAKCKPRCQRCHVKRTTERQQQDSGDRDG